MVAGATTAIATGLAAMGKAALDGYADYEQLVGGVDTLFKSSSQTIQDYANQAYKTAGVSANKYMETVTSFSASLIQSLDGDTEKAAKYADMAMVDMSDNANKMGTNIESIQNAYQGFAKQNYTMLDNLKLGYGGTQAEMERLVQDAAANVEAQERLGITVDATSLSFGNIVQAIHVVQDSLGILGTTSLEAESTISGSIGMLKASFDNLIVGFGNADADIATLCDNVINSFMLVVDNITPVIENIIQTLPKVMTNLIDAVGDLLPTLLDTVATLFTEALNMFVSLIPELIPAAVDAVMTIVGALMDNLPAIITAAIQIVMSLVEGITNALPQLIPSALAAVMAIVNGIVDNLPKLLEAATQIIITLAKMLTEPSMLFKLIETALKVVITLAEGIIDAIPQLLDAAVEIINNLIKYITTPGNLAKIIETAVQLVVELAGGIISAIPELVTAVVDLVASLIDTIFTTDWLDVGKNIVDGLLDGLKNAWETLTRWFSDAWDNLVGDVKDWLGIHSPSKVFAGIGENMALGVGVGWADSFEKIKDEIEGDMVFDGEIAVSGNGKGTSAKQRGVNVVQNIYASKMTPSEVFNEARYQQTRAVLFGV